jgi:hypothetical protein
LFLLTISAGAGKVSMSYALAGQESDAGNAAKQHGGGSACPKIAVNLTFMRVLVNWNKMFLGPFWINFGSTSRDQIYGKALDLLKS